MSESTLRRADEASFSGAFTSGKLAGLKVRIWCSGCRKWSYQNEAEALEELAQIRREYVHGGMIRIAERIAEPAETTTELEGVAHEKNPRV